MSARIDLAPGDIYALQQVCARGALYHFGHHFGVRVLGLHGYAEMAHMVSQRAVMRLHRHGLVNLRALTGIPGCAGVAEPTASGNFAATQFGTIRDA